ncbi:MAG TPA: lantibiotic dehydratase [Pirellulaceae bacterium]|nr:lantibiotic dehydratase [Pirellulaceae bacterium]
MYTVLNQVLVRTPLLPTESVSGQLIVSDLEKQQLAVAIGSPSLFKQTLNPEKRLGVRFPSRRYHKRMAFRPTPYGTFAGVSWGTFDETTNLCRSNHPLVTSTRPDMCWLLPLLAKWEDNRDLREHSRLFANPELVQGNGRVWLERTLTFETGSSNRIKLKAIESVLFALEHTKSGVDFRELAEELSSRFGASIEQATNLCHRLCDLKVLISDWRFAPADWTRFQSTLDERSLVSFKTQELLSPLCAALQSIKSWDLLIEKSGTGYLELLQQVEQLAPPKTKDLLQVDSSFELNGTKISHRVAEEMSMAMELLLRLSTYPRRDSRIVSFKNRFVERFQSGREVPILELLSPIFGLGSPYLDQLTFSDNTSHQRNTKLLSLVMDAQKRKAREIRLTDDDLNSLEMWKPNVSEAPLSLELFASVVAESRASIDQGDFQLLISPRIGDLGAGRSIGRFANLLGDEALNFLKTVASEEQKLTDALLVDLNYWPTFARLSNVIIAPLSRNHSISSNCARAQDKINIPLSEVNIGVVNDRFQARWTKTGQLIEVCSNNMLNTTSIPETLRFLIDISGYGKPRPVAFDWGSVSSLVFLPRVIYGKVILSAARWSMKPLFYQLKSSSDLSEFKNKLAEFRSEWDVPRFVQLANNSYSDNLLYLDLDDPEDQELLAQMLKTPDYSQSVCYEYIASDRWHTANDGHFATELVASLILNNDVRSQHEKAATMVNKRITRDDYWRFPGSDWIYLRLECSNEFHEEIVSQALKIAHQLKIDGGIKQWFFLPYIEQRQHQLRLRFQINDGQLYENVLPKLIEWTSHLVSSELCHSFSIVPYDREVERYGGVEAMPLVEEIFSQDSVLVSNIFEKIPQSDRTITGILTVNNLLDAFGLDTVRKIEFLMPAVRATSKDDLSKRYRQLKEGIHSALNRGYKTDAFLYLYSSLESISQNTHVLVEKLKSLEQEKLLGQQMDDILQSLIHVHCVRLFGINSSMELIVRALLAKGLQSALARK